MARYIDAYKLEKEFPKTVSKYNVVIDGSDYPVFLADYTLHKIRNFPTADVEEVVRCSECEFRDNTLIQTSQGFDAYHCTRHHSLILLTDFCNYGKRGTDNDL